MYRLTVLGVSLGLILSQLGLYGCTAAVAPKPAPAPIIEEYNGPPISIPEEPAYAPIREPLQPLGTGDAGDGGSGPDEPKPPYQAPEPEAKATGIPYHSAVPTVYATPGDGESNLDNIIEAYETAEKITYNVTAPVGPKGEGDGHGHVTISIDSELSEEKNEGIESVLVKLNKDGTPDKENYFTGVQDLLKGVIEYVMKLGTGGTYQEYLKYRSTDRFAAGTEVELPVGAYVVIIDGEQFIFEPAKKIVDPNEPQTWQDIEFDIDVPAAYQPEGTGKGGDGKTPNALAGSNATNFSDAGTS